MIPAVSHPAVPPPMMTTALTGCVTLKLAAYSDRERPSIVDHVQQLVVESTVRMIFGVVQVERLEEYAHVRIDVVARAEVHLRRGCQEGRLRAELRLVLLLTELQELLALPLHREARLEPMVLVEADEVRRIADTGQRELGGAFLDVGGIERLVRVNVGSVHLEPEA